MGIISILALLNFKKIVVNSRLIKILFGAAVALYISIVCFNNIFDYNSNFPFVKMVSSMEDTFSKERNGWRAIGNPFMHHALFICIIVWELIIAAFLWFGVYRMLRNLKSSAAMFKSEKNYTAIGLSLGVLLWFTVFIAIGGEWFLMWQSKTWNAQTTAFFLTGSFLLFLIHHNQEDA
jgi:predicted small integral membrane protein